jgi:hypothetical protein
MTKAQDLREQAARHDQDAADSFERCDTDGFVSQWASGINARQKRTQATIEEAGGVATFGRYYLTDLDGERVPAKLIEGRFGPCWALLDEDDQFTGEFIGAHPARESTLERKGYREAEEEFVAEATADLKGSGRGLSGAATVTVIVRPADRSVRYDRVIGIGRV